MGRVWIVWSVQPDACKRRIEDEEDSISKLRVCQNERGGFSTKPATMSCFGSGVAVQHDRVSCQVATASKYPSPTMREMKSLADLLKCDT
jgi:hypothetical protein